MCRVEGRERGKPGKDRVCRRSPKSNTFLPVRNLLGRNREEYKKQCVSVKTTTAVAQEGNWSG